MKVKQTYLKGKSVFVVSLLVIVITVLTVYLTGINHSRSLTANVYISLIIIAVGLFVFMAYGLYKGLGLIDNFPKFRHLKTDDFLSDAASTIDTSSAELDGGIGGLIISIVLWILMSIVFALLLAVLQAVFWFSIFITMAMLYWIFFRALKLVFKKSKATQGDIVRSTAYSFGYTLLYVGWIFAIVYLTQIIRTHF